MILKGNFVCKIPSVFSSYQYYLWDTCKVDTRACLTDENDFTTQIPVYDIGTGIDYINAKCAKCNGVKNAKIWQVTVECLDNYFENLTENSLSFEEIQAGLNAGAPYACKLNIQPDIQRAEITRNCSTSGYIDKCPENCQITFW